MEDEFRFIYDREIWYISALMNTKEIDIKKIIQEIQQLIIEKLGNLTKDDLKKISYNSTLVDQVLDCGKNISIQCEWVSFIDYFPFVHENLGYKFNSLGYFKFNVEYYPNTPEKKENIPAVLIQQLPEIALELLIEYCTSYINRYLYLDKLSPIYVFVASKKIMDKEGKLAKMEWSEDNIEKYKHIIGKWTEVYSGQWEDYSAVHYRRRVKDNFSNRLSELHYIRRNSGFIYMEEENYNMFFKGYMTEFVLEPTARVRALQYALNCINDSLDTLYSMVNYVSIDFIEQKMRHLRDLRGMVQTQMSIIYNELDYNRRQHYTRILTYLTDEFHLPRILKRISEKFEVIDESMEDRYREVDEANQKRTERSMNFLNFLFGFAVISEVVGALAGAISGADWIQGGIHVSVLLLVTIILFLVSKSFLTTWWGRRKPEVKKTADCLVIDGKNIALVVRKFPPCRGQLAFPGGFINKHESAREAAIREVREETGLKVRIIEKIGVYDDPERDPRGLVTTTAFLGEVVGTKELKVSEEAIDVVWKSIDELKGVDLAFDHEFILRDALQLLVKKGLASRELAQDFDKVLKTS